MFNGNYRQTVYSNFTNIPADIPMPEGKELQQRRIDQLANAFVEPTQLKFVDVNEDVREHTMRLFKLLSVELIQKSALDPKENIELINGYCDEFEKRFEKRFGETDVKDDM